MADEIGRAFQKVGGSAGALGVPFEQVSSWIAVISSKTRESAESIGTSLKSILARIQNMKAYGFDEEDGTKVNEVAKALAAVDIALMDTQGQFRNVGVIFDELGAKWDTLDSRQKAYLATTIAGTRQQSRFYALMDGYTEAVELHKKALDSAGIATQKFGIWQESTGAKIEKFQATMQHLWETIIDKTTIVGFIEIGTSFLEAITDIVEKLGLLPPVLAMMVGIATLLSSKFRALVIELLSATGAMRGLGVASQATAMGMNGAARGTMLLSTALKTLPLVALISALSFGVGLLIEWGFKALAAKKATQEAFDVDVTNLRSLQNDVEQVDKLKEKYDELRSNVSLTQKEKEELISVQGKLVAMFPDMVSGIDAEGNAIITDNQALDENIRLKKEQLELQKEEIAQSFKTYGDSQKIEIDNKKKQYEENKALIKNYYDEINKLKEQAKDYPDDPLFDTTNQIQKLSEKSSQLQSENQDLLKSLSDLNTKLKAGALEVLNLDEGFSKLEGTLKTNMVSALSEIGKLTPEIIQNLKDTNASKYFNDFSNALKEFNETGNVQEMSESFENFKQSLADIAPQIGMTSDEAIKLGDSIFKLQNPVKYSEVALYNFRTTLENVKKSAVKSTSDIIIAFAKMGISINETTAGILANYLDLILGIKNVATAHNVISKIIADDVNTGLPQGLVASSGKIKDVSAPLLGLGSAIEKAEALANGTSSSGDTFSSGGGSDKEAYQTDKYAQALEELNAQLEHLEYLKGQLVDTSEEYRDILEQEIAIQKKMQDLAHQEADRLRAKIASGALDAKGIDEAKSKILDLGDAWREAQEKINDLNWDIVESRIKEFDEQIDIITEDLDLLKSAMEVQVEGTDEYGIAMEAVTAKTIEYMQALKAKEMAIRADLANTNLTVAKQYELQNALRETINAQKQMKIELQNMLGEIADQLIDAYKRVYEKQKEDALDAIEDQMDAEERRHEEVMDNLEDELDMYNDIIDAKLRMLDAMDKERDYTRELDDLQKDRQEIQDELNALSLDDSEWSLSRQEDLRKELAQKDRDIEDLQYEYNLDLRKQNLQDQRDMYRDMIEAKRDAENEIYKIEKDNLEDMRKEQERYYDELINDERRWAEMKSDIVNGNLDSLKTSFVSFTQFILNNLNTIGDGIGINLIQKFGQALGLINSMSGLGFGEESYSYGSGSSSIGYTVSDYANENYVGNNLSGNTIGWNPSGNSGSGSYVINGTDTGTNYIPGTYINEDNRTIIDDFDAYEQYLRRYHDGGIVGSSSSKMVKLVNDLFNTAPNEQIVKALKEEIFIPKSNIPNFMDNIRNLVGSVPVQTPVTTVPTGDTVINNYSFNIESLTGDKSGAKLLFKEVTNALKKKGK